MKYFGAVLIFVVFCSGCGGRVTDISESMRTRSSLEFFRSLVSGLSLEQKEAIESIKDLYVLEYPDDPNLSQIDNKGTQWFFIESPLNKKRSFMVFDRNAKIKASEAVFISTPRSVRVGRNLEKRLVLTFSLDIIELDEDEFERRVEHLESE